MQKKTGPTMRFPCFSSSESINSCNTTSVACGYVRHFELWSEWTFELLNFRMLDETCWMKVCE